jgi:hypothetical protein
MAVGPCSPAISLSGAPELPIASPLCLKAAGPLTSAAYLGNSSHGRFLAASTASECVLGSGERQRRDAAYAVLIRSWDSPHGPCARLEFGIAASIISYTATFPFAHSLIFCRIRFHSSSRLWFLSCGCHSTAILQPWRSPLHRSSTFEMLERRLTASLDASK